MKLVTKLALIPLFACVIGCGSRIKRDDNIPASHANFPSAEFSACGKRFIGLGQCPVIKGEPNDSVKMQIMAYFAGTVRVVSQECQIDSSFRYNGSGFIDIYIPGRGRNNCVISFVVSPEFPKEDKSDIIVHSVEGHLLLRVTDPNGKWVGHSQKVRQGARFQFRIESDRPANFFLVGCGVEITDRRTPFEGAIEVGTDELGNDAIRACVYDGALIFDDNTEQRFTLAAWYFDPKYLRLPIPIIESNSRSINVLADGTVSIIAFDDQIEISNESRFRFDDTQTHVLRLLTVAGRTLVGDFDPQSGRWKWMD